MGGVLWELCFAVFFLVALCSGAPILFDACEATNCSSTGGPVIRFPFWRRDLQPPHCGYGSGFELSCEGNATVVELPLAGRFLVSSISYDEQRLHLDPTSCPLAAFLDLNLSNTPFVLHEVITGSPWSDYYMLLNCSAQSPIRYRHCYAMYCYPARCLDGYGCHFFGVETSEMDYLDETCVSMTTEAVPRSFVASLCSGDGDTYDPSLVWGTPDCRICEAGGAGVCSSSNTSSSSQQPVTCIPMPRSRSRRWATGSIIGVSMGAFLLMLALATIAKLSLSWKWNRDKETENQRKIEKFLEDYKALNPMRYSHADIKKITDQFKTKLGEGGCGSVYKGLLPSGIEVAVKVLIARTTSTDNNNDDGEEFVNEVRTIGRIHHVNVVRLLGFCADGNRRALIYEFMPNESLEKFIFPRGDSRGGGPSLGWAKLREIAVGIARGIEYLHQGCDQRILHFDIKPHNILLDHNLTPKISDFGLAKLCSKQQSAVSMTVARGTVGYIAPEVASRNVGNVSYKSDVYSFGMLLLEMVAGGRKKNVVDPSAENTSHTYFPHEWIYSHMIGRRQGGPDQIGLGIIEEEEEEEEEEEDANNNVARILTVTALWCIQWYPVNRPSMKSAVQMLEGSVDGLVIPPNPFVPSTSVQLEYSSDNSNLPPNVPGMNLAPISESEAEETDQYY